MADRTPASISHMDLVATLEREARALFCWNINIVASNPQQQRLRRALANEDLFSVVVDLFHTDTADYADLVLPAASFLEHDDLVASYFHHSVSAQVKAVEPPGEALPNSEVFRRLAAAMGYEDDELYESDGHVLQTLLDQTGIGIDFDTLAAEGTVWPDADPRLQFADLRFPTKSGRIEIASDAAEAAGLPRAPVAAADTRPGDGRLRLLSTSSEWMLNTTYGNDDGVDRRAGPMTITLNPVDAAGHGLGAGMVACVRSSEGELVVPVVVSTDVPPGVALMPKGRWPKREPTGANVNALNPGDRSDLGNSSAVHGTEVWSSPPVSASPPRPHRDAGSSATRLWRSARNGSHRRRYQDGGSHPRRAGRPSTRRRRGRSCSRDR